MNSVDDIFTAYAKMFEAHREADMSRAEYLEAYKTDPLVYSTATERLLLALAGPKPADGLLETRGSEVRKERKLFSSADFGFGGALDLELNLSSPRKMLASLMPDIFKIEPDPAPTEIRGPEWVWDFVSGFLRRSALRPEQQVDERLLLEARTGQDSGSGLSAENELASPENSLMPVDASTVPCWTDSLVPPPTAYASADRAGLGDRSARERSPRRAAFRRVVLRGTSPLLGRPGKREGPRIIT